MARGRHQIEANLRLSDRVRLEAAVANCQRTERPGFEAAAPFCCIVERYDRYSKRSNFMPLDIQYGRVALIVIRNAGIIALNLKLDPDG